MELKGKNLKIYLSFGEIVFFFKNAFIPILVSRMALQKTMEFSLNGTEIYWIQQIQGIW